MKKKTKSKKRRGARKVARKKRRSMGKKGQSNTFLGMSMRGLAKPLGGIAYGYMRDKISDWVASQSFAKHLPVTQFTDEAVMLAGAWGAKKLGLAKNPIGGAIIRTGEAYEWCRVGQTMSDLQQQKAAATSTGQTAQTGLLF